MFNPLIFDVAEKHRRELLEEAKTRQILKRRTMSHPIARARYIKAFHRGLLEKLPKGEHLTRRREATADRGLR
jgi:hypothetical protein